MLHYNMIICISKSLNHHYLQWHVFYLYLPAEQVMPNQHIADTFFDLDILWHASFWYFPVHRQVESQLRQNSAERDTISGWQFSKKWYVLVVTPSPFHMCTTIGIAPSPLSMHLFYGNYLYSSIWYQWYLYLDMGELCMSVPYSHDWWVNSWGFASYWKLTINCPYR